MWGLHGHRGTTIAINLRTGHRGNYLYHYQGTERARHYHNVIATHCKITIICEKKIAIEALLNSSKGW